MMIMMIEEAKMMIMKIFRRRERSALYSLLVGVLFFCCLVVERQGKKLFLVTAFQVQQQARSQVGISCTSRSSSEEVLLVAATRHPRRRVRLWLDSSSNGDDNEEDGSSSAKEEKEEVVVNNNDNNDEERTKRKRMKKRLRSLARDMVIKPISYAAPVPQAIASVLKDATLSAVDIAVEEVANVRARREKNKRSKGGGIVQDGVALSSSSGESSNSSSNNNNKDKMVDMTELIDEAFMPLERTLDEMEDSLIKARKSMEEAKSLAGDALGAVQAAAIAQVEGATVAVAAAEKKVIDDIFSSVDASQDLSDLTFDDVDYGTSEMAPPFLNEDLCLVPGEPVVRVEKAPQNSRRIFAGVDVMASVDSVWNCLTDYSNLQNVVPNLVVNDVLEEYGGILGSVSTDTSKPVEVQCCDISQKMKGSLLKQVGGAKVAGINFSARTTLEVREWPQGLPDFAHFNDEVWDGKDRQQRAVEYSKVKLQRYRFPRPFAVSKLPTRDISMQNIENDDGEFRMYQGVWRMQPLPGCAPPGQEAMRLTYAVEVSPRAYLPVQLIEGRIVRDLCTNLEAIRDFVSARTNAATAGQEEAVPAE